ncbi:Metal-dependent hydrolase YbeY, involved in rRNA and/or ribosome maturation and assembly [hydrothermal vent metagenome]|uniref:Metal-dependent hydrolase YbeY, involved in rRNA and/or ribosome maturation and assembly n=1 Tax=hydrothermal vent metagenome TaxID=652676 RepID=A0A1W1EJI1_9ZZZZ
MITLDNQTTYNIELDLLEDIILEFTSAEVELIVCNSDYIREINYEYRGKNTSTDVLSFPIEGKFENMPLGTIIINIDKVIEVSKSLNHTINNEFTLLFIHGMLHLLGYDHEIDNGEMREEEIKLINQFKLPKSLIVRVEES